MRSCVVVLTWSRVPEINYEHMPDDVSVLHKRNTPRWFRKQPAIYNAEQVDALI